MPIHTTILQKIYHEAIDEVATENNEINLSENMQQALNIIVSRSESNKAVIRVSRH